MYCQNCITKQLNVFLLNLAHEPLPNYYCYVNYILNLLATPDVNKAINQNINVTSLYKNRFKNIKVG